MLVIMQGVPGSGKSTKARQIALDIVGCIYSTDDYFMVDGVYKFDPSYLSEYHQRNQEKAAHAMKVGGNVIIDNCNLTNYNIRPYVEVAVSLNIPIVFCRCNGKFQNTHNVPQDKVEKMRSIMEVLDVETALQAGSNPQFQVFDNNKPANYHHHPVDHGWKKSIYDTFEDAQAYAQHWLDMPLTLKINQPVDYSGCQDFIEIRRVHNPKEN